MSPEFRPLKQKSRVERGLVYALLSICLILPGPAYAIYRAWAPGKRRKDAGVHNMDVNFLDADKFWQAEAGLFATCVVVAVLIAALVGHKQEAWRHVKSFETSATRSALSGGV